MEYVKVKYNGNVSLSFSRRYGSIAPDSVMDMEVGDWESFKKDPNWELYVEEKKEESKEEIITDLIEEPQDDFDKIVEEIFEEQSEEPVVEKQPTSRKSSRKK